MSTTPPTAPVAPESGTRSKGVATTALVLAIVGLLVSLVGFLPIVWVGIIGAAIGGLVLLAAFIVAIVGLAGRRNGGKPLSIAALIVSVLGGIVVSIALLTSIVFTGLELTGNASSTPAATAGESGTTADGSDGTAEEGDALTPAEQSFIDDVRPQVDQIMQQVDPTLTPDLVEQAFPDESLLMIGQALLATGEAGIDSFVDQTLATAGDTVDAEQLRSLYQTIYDSAVTHLQ